MEQRDLQALANAKYLLERPGLTARIAGVVGAPLEKGMKLLPSKVQSLVHKASEKAIGVALHGALSTLEKSAQHKNSSNGIHKLMVAGTGGLGGLLGASTLIVELPVSTMLMMRSILDIARSEGEDLTLAEAQLACVEVFALGGRATSDDAAGSGYFMTRTALASTFADAVSALAGRSLAGEGSSLLTRFIAKIASRFQIVVGEKLAAQAMPLIGALGGAGINVLFMDHFQDMARGHFVVRRLERKYGSEEVRRIYENLNEEKTI
ncbi:MAG: EcsC family protein [Bdellovibrio sp.]